MPTPPTTIVHPSEGGVPVLVTHRFAMTGYRLVGHCLYENAGISPVTDGPWMAVCRRKDLGTYATREEAERAALDALIGAGTVTS